jgi:hypothetical protein
MISLHGKEIITESREACKAKVRKIHRTEEEGP